MSGNKEPLILSLSKGERRLGPKSGTPGYLQPVDLALPHLPNMLMAHGLRCRLVLTQGGRPRCAWRQALGRLIPAAPPSGIHSPRGCALFQARPPVGAKKCLVV